MLLLALLSTAQAAPPGWTLVPFGVGVYVHGKPVRGVVYSATQAVGVATLTYASIQADSAALAEDEGAFKTWQAVSMAGVTVAAASFLVSVLDGSRLHDLEKDTTARDQVIAWDSARTLAARER
ncbi:MAG: hypothetical protein Q8P41_09925 [Pseudomonadota bacterium]|nr:hypothetical protein [Pseudomonadota bacterium]